MVSYDQLNQNTWRMAYHYQQKNGMPIEFQHAAIYGFHDSVPVVYAHQPNDWDSSSSHYFNFESGGGQAGFGFPSTFTSHSPQRPDSPYIPPDGASPYPRHLPDVPLAPEYGYMPHEPHHVPYAGRQAPLPSYSPQTLNLAHPQSFQDPTYQVYEQYQSVAPSQLNPASGSTSTNADGAYSFEQLVRTLRRDLNLHPSVPLNLQAIQDPGPSQKPSPQYLTLVQVAILSSPNQKLTLQDIYKALQDRFQYFQQHHGPKEKWKESIRHMLTLKRDFVKIPRGLTEPGKGSYWALSLQEGNTRPRYRRDKTNRERFVGVPLPQHFQESEEQESDTEPGSSSRSPGPSQVVGSRQGEGLSLSVDVRASPDPSDSGSSYIDSPASASVPSSVGPRRTPSRRKHNQNY